MCLAIVKPTRCTISQIYFIFVKKFYMFRTVFPYIIRILRLYIQHQIYVIQFLWLLASKQPQNLVGFTMEIYYDARPYKCRIYHCVLKFHAGSTKMGCEDMAQIYMHLLQDRVQWLPNVYTLIDLWFP